MKTFLRSLFAIVLVCGLMGADEAESPRVDLKDVPLAEAIQRIEEATGRKVEVASDLVQGKVITFSAGGSKDEIFQKFSSALEATQGLTLLRLGEGFRVHRFVPAKGITARPVPRSHRFRVNVIEGTVALVGGRGQVLIRAGETSSIEAGSLPTEPAKIDPSTIAPWRFQDAVIGTGLDAEIPLPPLRCRWIGDTPDGKAIVEVDIDGVKQSFVFGELEIAGMDRGREVLEGRELEILLPVKLKLNRGSK